MNDQSTLRRKSRSLPFVVPDNRWSEAEVVGKTPAEILLYRSHLLGSDLTVTNAGGGNTSAKLGDVDPLTGAEAVVLWVKGSGGDIGSMKLDGFATLYQDKLLSLEALYRGLEHEDEMVDYLPHCTFSLNQRPASIDTPLHAYLPYPHIDHVHPDAITALATSANGREVTEKLWGGRIGWIGWQRPGFELGLRLRDYVAANPELEGVILASHGLVSWGSSAKECYDRTIDIIVKAAEFLNEKIENADAFGGPVSVAKSSAERRKVAVALMPRLRGLMAGGIPKVGHFSDDAATLEFVCSRNFLKLAAIGTSCPDHFLRTKITPLALDPDKIDQPDYLETAVGDYRASYAAYYDRCVHPGDPAMRDANPVVILVSGVGRITFAANKQTARIAGEFYGNAINVMRGAEAIGQYVGLPEQEAFNIEYWALEEAKIQRLPKPKALQGKVAVVTGGAGGIGAATTRRLLADGASVMLLDLDAVALQEVFASLQDEFGKDVVRAETCDVTNETQVQASFEAATIEFGGLDILVANAGIASSSPIEETTVALWRKNYDVLTEGYFLTARSAFSLMRIGGGGSIVFIGSKNGIAAASNASAYASAKAASLHLARCLAVEGAQFGIRVNVVNPDAVIRGSRIWGGSWRKERAETHGIDVGAELEEHYRKRSLLKRDVLPEDVAEAVNFFASEVSSKSTGNMINVDGGNAQAFSR